MSVIRLPVEKVKEFMEKSFLKCGVPKDDVAIVVDVLIRSDIRGIESHGIGRLKMYLDFIKDKVQNPVTNVEIVKDTPGTALIDGNYGMGHVISYRAMSLAIEKAKMLGVGAVAVKNSTHFGICGYYPLMAAEEGMIGLAVTNARPTVAPTFSNEPMYGTNPIAFSAPTDEEHPFILDMATSIIQKGKVEILEREKKPVAAGLVIDKEGNSHTDPGKILQLFRSKQAALLPLGGIGEKTGGHKGYGLGLMVEILSSALSGGPFSNALSGFDKDGNKIPNKLGHFFLAINVSNFIDLEEFKSIAGNIVRTMRNANLFPGQERIYVAGEKGFARQKRILKEGVPINDAMQKTMLEIKNEYELDIELPF
ncbi:Ldh family oxidoreductase [candidate division KSB1 bacterium]|nr:Ldh family oxidoreductase [candidate division KSB1 bacterium]